MSKYIQSKKIKIANKFYYFHDKMEISCFVNISERQDVSSLFRISPIDPHVINFVFFNFTKFFEHSNEAKELEPILKLKLFLKPRSENGLLIFKQCLNDSWLTILAITMSFDLMDNLSLVIQTSKNFDNLFLKRSRFIETYYTMEFFFTGYSKFKPDFKFFPFGIYIYPDFGCFLRIYNPALETD